MSWAIFQFVLIGFSPFYEPKDGVAAAAAGNATRQIVYISMFILVLPIAWHIRDRLAALAREMYVFLFALGICWASVLWAISPQISFRRVVLVTMILFVLTVITAVHRSVDSWMKMLLATSAVVIVLNWFGVIFLPHLAITNLGWSGAYDHKNIAGGAIALITLWWIFAAANAQRPWLFVLYLAGAVLGFAFLLGTQSKTSISLFVAFGTVGLIVEIAARGGSRAFAMIACMVPGVIVLLTAGLLWLTPRKFLIMTFGDPTITGRTVIWRFMVRQINERPIEGHGYGSFWMIGNRSPVVREGIGWFTGTTQGHNGYLDLAATIGLVGTSVFVMSFVLTLWTAGRLAWTKQDEGGGRYVGLFVALICFALAHNMLESTFLRGSHPVWVSAFISMVVVALIWARQMRQSATPVHQTVLVPAQA